MRNSKIIFVLILTSVLLSACAAGPDKAAKEWFNATMNYDGAKIMEYTCKAERENMQIAGLWSSAFSLLPQLLPQLLGINLDISSDIDTKDLRFTTISNDDQTAYVHVTGEIRVAVLAFADIVEIDEVWRMKFEDNKWKWCGE